MSRHLVLHCPRLKLVLGYDHMLRSFFGQRFDPSDARRSEIAIVGWPTRSGLGTRRPVLTHSEAEDDLRLLVEWVLMQDWRHAPSLIWAAHLARVRSVLLREWDDGEDGQTPSFPTILREEA